MDKYIIGENAGKVWRLLNSDHLRKWEFSEIKKITGMDDAELGSAIGWLAREDKVQWGIDFSEIKSKFGKLYVLYSEVFDGANSSKSCFFA